MDDIVRLLARIESLEMRAAHQDRVIEDLNTVVTDQWNEIDMLKQQIAQLCDRIQELENSRDDAGLPNPPPPHY